MRDVGSKRQLGVQWPQREEAIPLRVGGQIVGRAADSDIMVPHPTVSRRHAEILISARLQVTVRDLRSRNGTYINGERIKESHVSENDRIEFGVVPFRIELQPLRLVRVVQFDDSTAELGRENAKNPSPTIALSPARQRVLTCLLEGLSEKQIAAKLHVSTHTVHNQVRDIYRQFNVNTRAELLVLFVPRS